MTILEQEIKKLDRELYRAQYINKDLKRVQELWNDIKKNQPLLENCMEVIKDQFGERETFLSPSAVELMLLDYEHINKNVYQLLVDKIYSNRELARIVLEGQANGGRSLLLMTLWNPNLILTDKQKKFAIDEAMNKVGTVKYKKDMENYQKELDESFKISGESTIVVPEIGSMDAKMFNLHFGTIFYKSNSSQAHGTGCFDIRYWILKNHNFADNMEKLVYDFYAGDYDYENRIDQIKSSIANKYNKKEISGISSDDVLSLTTETILAKFPLKRAAKIIEEIDFLKKVNNIRPIQGEAVLKKQRLK